MNLYQAGYFRRGRQGSSAGWGIVSPSRGMSQIAKDGFKGIAAKLVELKGIDGIPAVNMGIYLHDRFIYLMHVNYTAKGDDARGVTFVHGYCFNISDYYELCSRPEMLCGVTEDNFLMEYDSSVEAYPIAEGLSYESFDFGQLLCKYGLDDEEYKKLVFGAINALENYSNPLCIKLGLPCEQYMQASKELLYLIMMGLPYHLRIRVSFFSYTGAGAAIYVSDHVEGNNYVDLDKHEFAVDTARLTQFYFTRIYNTVPAADYRKRAAIFQTIAEFMNTAFENPMRDTGCTQIEAGFQAKIKKNDIEGILPETAFELLTAFLRSPLTENDEVYEYLTELIRVMNNNSMFITDEKIRKHVEGLYSRTEREDYRREICSLTAREILNQEQKKGFDGLNRLLNSSKEQYEAVLSQIRERNEAYYVEYYYTSFLPFFVTGLDKLDKYLKEHEKIEIDEYKVLLQILNSLIKKEMPDCGGYEQLISIRDKVSKLLDIFPKELEENIDDVWRYTHFVFWNCFNISEFDVGLIDRYRKLKVEELAEEGWSEEECTNAVKVVRLIELFEETEAEEVRDILCKVLFGNKILENAADKRYIQEIFLSNKMDELKLNKPAGFDCMLAMFYDCKGHKFDMLGWGTYIRRRYQDAFEPTYITQMQHKSKILNNERLRERVLESLQADIKAAKKSDDNSYSKRVLKGLKAYSDCLCGKELKSENELEAMQFFANALHRIGIGALLLFTAGLLLRCINNLQIIGEAGIFGTAMIIIPGIFIVLFLLALGIKIYLADGITGLMENFGIITVPRLLIYTILNILLLAGIAALLLLADRKVIIIGAVAYSVVAVISAIAYCVCAQE